MSDIISNILKNNATQVTGTKSSNTKVDTVKKNETVSQDEFLQLLVTQLQNQDPLNPMENEEFAVQLATFSQLEQLVQINGKLEGERSGGEIGSMASYLGHEVALPEGRVQVRDGSGSNLYGSIPAGAESLRVDLINETGEVVSSSMIEPVPNSGSQVIPLEDVDAPDGSYEVRVVSVGQDGRFNEIPVQATGTVEGFVMEPEPMLLVGGQEVALSEISQVFNGKK